MGLHASQQSMVNSVTDLSLERLTSSVTPSIKKAASVTPAPFFFLPCLTDPLHARGGTLGTTGGAHALGVLTLMAVHA